MRFQELHRVIPAVLAILVFLPVVTAEASDPMPASSIESSRDLWRWWSENRFVESWQPNYSHGDLVEDLERLQERHPTLQVDVEGTSYEGRAIHRIRLGDGRMPVLLWSQMHGDEPSATPALLDIIDFLSSHPQHPLADPILSHMTLDIVPMLNPDGAERYTRRNAQAIDINRDALNLATPEGRLLKRVRDTHEHELGFNLHDQGRRKEVGDTDVLATAAVLAVVGDEAKTVTPGRERAMRVCAAIAAVLHQQYPGGVARYNDSFNERAFGDNVTAWGTPVVLLESGGLPDGEPVENLVRLNFVSLLHALHEVARNDAADYEEATYSQIPFNRNGPWVDVLLRGAEIQQSPDATPYRADLAFNVERADRAPEVDLDSWLRPDERRARSWIRELGDARALEGTEELQLDGHLVRPALQLAARGYSARKWLGGDSGSGSGLEHLARLGVAELHWMVPPKRLRAAQELAASWRREGRTLVRVVAEGSPTAHPQLDRLPPDLPGNSRLGDFETLHAQRPDSAPGPLLRPDAAASFVVFGPAPAGENDSRPLHSIWIDGVRVR